MEAPFSLERREWSMTRYDQETKDRRHPHVHGASRRSAARITFSLLSAQLHDLTGIPVDTMRGWVDRARIDAGDKPGLTTTER